MPRIVNRIPVTERDLREQVRDICKLFGWKMQFTLWSIHSPKGFPDLFLANAEQRRIIFAELKSEKGKLTPEQEEWLEILKACGQETYLWRPADILGIVEILREPSKEGP